MSESGPAAEAASAPIRSEPHSSASTGSSIWPRMLVASVSTPAKVSSTATGAKSLAMSGSLGGSSALMPCRIGPNPRAGPQLWTEIGRPVRLTEAMQERASARPGHRRAGYMPPARAPAMVNRIQTLAHP